MNKQDKLTLDPALMNKLRARFPNGRKLVPPRKNLCYMIQLVNGFIDLGAEQVTSQELQQAVDELGWRQKWSLADNVLRKELAGLAGGYGLRLPKLRSRDANVYRLPQDKIGDEYLKGVGIDPDLVRQQGAADDQIVRAIRERRQVSFRYRGDPSSPPAKRVVNLHFYGVQSGAVNVEGLQVSGYSSQGNLPAWRVFRLDDMKQTELLDDTFSPWPGYRTDHVKYANPIAMIPHSPQED